MYQVCRHLAEWLITWCILESIGAVQAPAASKARDLEEDLERAAHTPLPEDADHVDGNDQTNDPADGTVPEVL